MNSGILGDIVTYDLRHGHPCQDGQLGGVFFFSTTGQRISQGSRFGGLDVKGMWDVNHGPWLPWPFHVNFERNGDPQKIWPQFRIL